MSKQQVTVNKAAEHLINSTPVLGEGEAVNANFIKNSKGGGRGGGEERDRQTERERETDQQALGSQR